MKTTTGRHCRRNDSLASRFSVEVLENRLLLSGSVLDLDSSSPAIFPDADGDLVTVVLSGPGHGTVTLTGDGSGDIAQISLGADTTIKTVLSVKVHQAGSGTGVTQVGDLLCLGPMGGIKAPVADLAGTVDGDDLHQLTLGAGGNTTIVLGRVAEASILSSSPIKSFTAVQWLDSDGVPDLLSAPSIGALGIAGRKANAFLPAATGDFEADMQINSGGASGSLVLGKVNIAGALRDSAWDITGNVGTLAVKSEVDQFSLTLHSSIKSFKAATINDAILNVDDAIGSVSTASWATGQIVADSVGSLKITGSSDFGATLDVGSLGTAKIGGALAGGGTIHGDVKSLWADRLGASLTVEGRLKSLKLNQHMGIVAPDAPGAVLHLVGGGSAKTANGNISFDGSTDLYPTTADMYQLEDLRAYDALSRWWDYDCVLHAMGQTATATANVSIGDSLHTYDGHDCYVVNTDISSDEGDASVSAAWYTDSTGTHLAMIDSNGTSIDVGSLDLCPQFVQYGQKYIMSSPFTTDVSVDVGIWVTGTMTGVATVSCELLGHEQVTVPAGTFLTAKVQINTKVTGVLDLWVDVNGDGEDEELLAHVTTSQNETLWCDPSVGPVKVKMTLGTAESIRGYGSMSVRASATMLLTDWG